MLIGRIERPHGVRGEVRVRLFSEEPEAYVAREFFLAMDDAGNAYSMPVAASRMHQNVLLVLFQGVQNRDQAEALRGRALYIRRSEMAAPGRDEYYYIDLVGLRVYVVRDGLVSGEAAGTVVTAFSNGSHGVLELELRDWKKTVFVPFINEAVPDVNLSSGWLSVREEFIV